MLFSYSLSPKIYIFDSGHFADFVFFTYEYIYVHIIIIVICMYVQVHVHVHGPALSKEQGWAGDDQSRDCK